MAIYQRSNLNFGHICEGFKFICENVDIYMSNVIVIFMELWSCSFIFSLIWNIIANIGMSPCAVHLLFHILFHQPPPCPPSIHPYSYTPSLVIQFFSSSHWQLHLFLSWLIIRLLHQLSPIPCALLIYSTNHPMSSLTTSINLLFGHPFFHLPGNLILSWWCTS